MGCPAQVILNENLVFSVCTHDPDTAKLKDAESLPTYRIYEDANVAPPVLSGTMAKLDDLNTLGFYVKEIPCTVANGFEIGKTYTIYIRASVAGDTETKEGGISFGFKVMNQSGYSLSDAGVDKILDEVIEGSLTLRQMLRIFMAVLGGISLGGGSALVKFRDLANSKDRVQATVDAYGNRNTINLDGS